MNKYSDNFVNKYSDNLDDKLLHSLNYDHIVFCLISLFNRLISLVFNEIDCDHENSCLCRKNNKNSSFKAWYVEKFLRSLQIKHFSLENPNGIFHVILPYSKIFIRNVFSIEGAIA